MSESGVVIVVLRIYSKSRRLVADPDVISRGFIYGSELTEITRETAKLARKAYEDAFVAGEKDRKAVKHAITGALHRYFRRKIDREPMVVPVIVEV